MADKMKSSWFKGLDDERKLEVRKDFRSSTIIRKRLRTICLDKIQVTANAGRNKEDYECANWAYKQADSRGYERALTEIAKLLE